MKSINLQFIGLGYNNINQADVKVYDIHNNLIVSKKTYNNCINICLKTNQVYRVYVKSMGEVINTYFYVNKYNNNYIFTFNHAIYNPNIVNSITFLLSDFNYNNLPIEKGKIIVWQKQ